MSFIRNFMTWTEGTEVPENYYFWSAVSALASMVGGRVWSYQGRFVIHPNLYVVLLGPPHSGKTAAKRCAEDVIRAVGDIPISVESETKESLTRYMRDFCAKTMSIDGESVVYTPISILLNELSNFLGPNSGHMIDFLTGIWDCGNSQYGVRTKNKGEDILPRPYVNLLACTTQEWVTSYLRADIIGGGFSRRVIFVNEPNQDDTKRIPRPVHTNEQLEAFKNVVAYGKVLLGVQGEVHWEPAALHFYDKWYLTRDIPRDPDTRGFHKSKPTLLFKLAPLVALSKLPELRVQVDDIEVALALLEKTEANLGRVFQGMGRNELNAVANKIVEYLWQAPEKDYKDGDVVRRARFAPEKTIRATFYKEAPSRELDDILSHLTASDKIFRYVVSDKGVARTFIGLKDSISVVPQRDNTSAP